MKRDITLPKPSSKQPSPERSFEARYPTTFQDDMSRLELSVQRDIVKAIEAKLLLDPFRHAKKLKNVLPGAWKFRVGDYRIRFDIEGSILILYRVRHRKEIYR